AAHRLDGRLLHLRVSRQAEVVVRAEHEDLVVAHADLGRRPALLEAGEFLEKGVNARRLKLAQAPVGVAPAGRLVEQVFDRGTFCDLASSLGGTRCPRGRISPPYGR